jgi:magnesium transporter
MDEAIAYLRRQAGQVETIYEAYVLDSDQRLLGVVSLHDLLSAAKTQTVKTVMRTRFKSVRSDERQEAIEKPIADHRLLAVPVVDAGGAMQATRSGAGRDMQKVGGMAALGAPYLDTPLRNML